MTASANKPSCEPYRGAIEPAPSDRAAEADGEPPSPSCGRIAVDIVHDGGDWRAFGPTERLIAHAASVVGVCLELAQAEVAIALSSDEQVRALNRSFRGKDAPTNVLSFPSRAGAAEQGFLGDIALASETIAREAADMGLPPADHLQHLVVHGLLHLLGHDHEEEADAQAMEALETKILARLGIADPYAEQDDGDPGIQSSTTGCSGQ